MEGHDFSSPPEVKAREMELRAGSARLRALLAVPPSPSGWVIFAHEGGNSLHGSAHRSVARALNQAGLATLSMELLSAAEAASRAKLSQTPLMADRLRSGAEWLQSRADGLLGCFGAGEGAAAALWAASQKDSAIATVVSCAGRLDLAAERLGQVQAPVLLIAGGADRRALKQVRWARKRLASSELVIVPGATRLFDAPAALKALADRSVDWFKRALVGETPAMEEAQAGLSREGRRRLAAAASLLMLSGFVLGPKTANAVVTASYDSVSKYLAIAVHDSPFDGDNISVTGSAGGNVTVLSQVPPSAPVPVTIVGGPVPTAEVRSIWVDEDGIRGGDDTAPAGYQWVDFSGVSAANGFTPSYFGIGGTGLPTSGNSADYGIGCKLGNSSDTAIGSEFSDYLNVGNGDASYVQLAVGNGGMNHIDGGNNAESMVGGPMMDYFAAGGGNDTIDAGDGDDSIGAGGANDLVLCGAGNDNVTGGAGNDSILGGDGDDTITLGQGSDTADGGPGIDQVINAAPDGNDATVGSLMTIIPGGAGAGTIQTSSGSPPTVQTAIFTTCEIPGMTGAGGYVTDTVAGNESVNDTLDASGWTGTLGVILNDGNSGNDILIGTNYNDTLRIAWGNDSVVAGLGTDVLTITANAQTNTVPAQIAVTLTGGASDAATFTDLGVSTVTFHDSLSGVESLIVQGGGGGDTLNISAVSIGSPTVNGGGGVDVITGSSQGDVLNGQGDNDSINGAAGNDVYMIGSAAGFDTLFDSAGDDTVDFSLDAIPGLVIELGSLNAHDGENSISSSSAIENIVGSPQADLFIVTPSASTGFDLDGGDGNDRLRYDGSGLSITVTTSGNPAVPSTIAATGKQNVTFLNIENWDTVLPSNARAWQIFE